MASEDVVVKVEEVEILETAQRRLYAFNDDHDELGKLKEYSENPMACGDAMTPGGLVTPRGENFVYVITKHSAMRALRCEPSNATVMLGNRLGNLKEEQKDDFSKLLEDPAAKVESMEIMPDGAIMCVDKKGEKYPLIFPINADIICAMKEAMSGGGRRRGGRGRAQAAPSGGDVSKGVSLVNTQTKTLVPPTGGTLDLYTKMVKGDLSPTYNRFGVLECPEGAFAITSVSKMCEMQITGAMVLLESGTTGGWFAKDLRPNQHQDYNNMIQGGPATAMSGLLVDGDQLFSPDRSGHRFQVIVWVNEPIARMLAA